MSHISNTKIRFDSKEAVIRMCELVPEYTFHDRKKFKSYGHGGNPNVKCDFCISIEGADYEVGFGWQDDGSLKPLVDFWSSGGLTGALGGKDMTKLKTHYNLGKTHYEATRMGYEVAAAKLPDGKYKLLVTEKKNKRNFQWGRTIKEKFKGMLNLSTAGA